LPSHRIMKRWTKYAKRGFYVEKHGIEKESLTNQAARISRKATSIALKCSLLKELLDDLEKAIDNLDLEADNAIIKTREKTNEIPLVLTDCATDTLTGKILFRVPSVVEGPKNDLLYPSKRERKRKGKKKTSGNNKGIESTNSSSFFIL
jgi:hypothetical protein